MSERRQREDALREQLAEMEFDGPYEVGTRGFDPASSFLGGGPTRYAICLRCAAMVRLDDPEECDGRTIERSVRIHGEWHEDLAAKHCGHGPAA